MGGLRTPSLEASGAVVQGSLTTTYLEDTVTEITLRQIAVFNDPKAFFGILGRSLPDLGKLEEGNDGSLGGVVFTAPSDSKKTALMLIKVKEDFVLLAGDQPLHSA